MGYTVHPTVSPAVAYHLSFVKPNRFGDGSGPPVRAVAIRFTKSIHLALSDYSEIKEGCY